MEATERTSADLANDRREELLALMNEHDGTLAPRDVVAFARNEDTALHSLFTWEDDVAAELWRLNEAQKYIRAQVTMLPVKDSGKPVAVRAWVSLPSDRETGIYRPIVRVLNDDTMRAELLAEARREFRSFKQKYGHLETLSSAIETLALALAT